MRLTSRSPSTRNNGITSSTWIKVEYDPPIAPRRRRVIIARIILLCLIITMAIVAAYIPFSNFVIASGFVCCTLSICAMATALIIQEQRSGDEERATYTSVPTNETINELMSSAAMIANARNVSAERVVGLGVKSNV